MTVDFDLMSSADIAGLIESASAVLKARLTASAAAGDAHEKAILEAATKKPSISEIQHIKDCLRIYRESSFVYADDVREYRRIARKFPEFMALERYPNDCRGTAIQRWNNRQGGK